RHTSWPRDWSSDVCSSDLGNHILCYCCRGYDCPCLQNIPTKKTPVNKQDLEENSQPSPILPLVAPKEVNQHQMGIPAPVDKVSEIGRASCREGAYVAAAAR